MPNMTEKRINVFENGSQDSGKVVIVPKTLPELFNKLSIVFNMKIKVKRIFNEKGCEIDDLNTIRENDIIYISAGEDFIVGNKKKLFTNNSDWIKLNVGGKLFTTSKSTLKTKEPQSMLARMFAEDSDGFLFSPSNIDENGAYLIDRSSTYFEPILNYLRSGQLIYDHNINPEGILEEARFFGIDSIISILEDVVSLNKIPRDRMPLTRRDVINALISCPFSSELRFQGVNLAGADLSKLDLRNINFKYANLRGCELVCSNLSYCCLERADLAYASLDGAQLYGVKGLCTNMEGAQLKKCNFEDPCGSRTNMEGVNLKGANLEGSCLAGVNLRVATLKNANLRNCDLRAAVLAGADLENCDLSGSDLQEANLRGANFKNASFDLMLTPLHMAQAIR